MRVVLVRPWTDAHAGGGCCGGEARDGIVLEPGAVSAHRHDPGLLTVAAAYRLLRAELPDADVQVVGAANTAYLLPSTFRAVRRRRGTLRAVLAAARSTRAGAVLVNGEVVGDIADLGPEGVLARVRLRARSSGPRREHRRVAPR